jgi:hypothetical protein
MIIIFSICRFPTSLLKEQLALDKQCSFNLASGCIIHLLSRRNPAAAAAAAELLEGGASPVEQSSRTTRTKWKVTRKVYKRDRRVVVTLAFGCSGVS